MLEEAPALRDLFEATFGEKIGAVEQVGAHASQRKIFRLTGAGKTVIGIANSNLAENRAFIAFTRHFERFHLPVPQIFAHDAESAHYLEEDLGPTTLYDLLLERRSEQNPFPAEIEAHYVAAVKLLPRFQIEAGASLDYSYCFERAAYDRESMLYDMHYFRDELLKRKGIAYDEGELTRDFERFAEFLLKANSNYFLYRDFQSRNIMIKKGAPAFIDYQAGRRGALQYDLAALLFQTRAKVPPEARERILSAYLGAASALAPIQRDSFHDFFYGFVYIRLMQVLGAYGKLGLGQGKQYFLEGIPHAAALARELMASIGLPVKLPEVKRVFQKLADGEGNKKGK